MALGGVSSAEINGDYGEMKEMGAYAMFLNFLI
jgi:hypothetical protein